MTKYGDLSGWVPQSVPEGRIEFVTGPKQYLCAGCMALLGTDAAAPCPRGCPPVARVPAPDMVVTAVDRERGVITVEVAE